MKKENMRIKVLVALSGGVDSSVAAALLVKQGYDVSAAYMVNYDDKKEQLTMNNEQAIASCWIPDYRDAVRVAAHLNIPIIKLDFTKEYKEKVLDYMFAEYRAGRTPNPDVMCNKYIKFGVWLEHARKLGFDYLATGHYARREPGIFNFQFPISKQSTNQKSKIKNLKLLEAKDKNKDQTYFLHQLSQEQLARTMFPIGDYTKPEVRKLAQKFKLPTAEKEESMGICFVGEVPMKEFLEQRIPPKPGNIILSLSANGLLTSPARGEVVTKATRGVGESVVIGTHDGLAFYTIGQRHSLNVSSRPSESRERVEGSPDCAGRLDVARDDNRPLYVIDKNIKTNELVVGYEDDPLLYKKEISVTDVHWVHGTPPPFPLKCAVRLRHREILKKCVVTCHSERSGAESRNPSTVNVTFIKPERAVTPGQFAVFYKNGECLGGGVIQ